MKRFKSAKEIRVAVIGYGPAFGMGRHHLREMADAGMTPTAVVDTDRERVQAARSDFPGIETYTSAAAMLRKSPANLVTVITPHNTHARLALQCLQAGRHVVCEKPFAVTTAECDAMIAEARRRKLVLSTYHNRHWDGCILQALKEIRRRRIGDVYRVTAWSGRFGKPQDWWRSSRSRSGGVLYDWGVHLLEYALQVIASEIVEVSGFEKTGVWARHTAWKEDTNEDEATAVVRFRNGTRLTLTASHLDLNPRPSTLEFTGTKGTYLMSGDHYEILTRADDTTVRVTGPNPPSEGWRFYRNIADHMVKGVALVITPEWARRPIQILDLAARSAKKGRTLRAKYP